MHFEAYLAQVEEVKDSLAPDIYGDYKTLKRHIRAQRDENEALRDQLEAERQKTQKQRELIEVCKERILRMEEQVGLITDNPNYTKDESAEDELINAVSAK